MRKSGELNIIRFPSLLFEGKISTNVQNAQKAILNMDDTLVAVIDEKCFTRIFKLKSRVEGEAGFWETKEAPVFEKSECWDLKW